MGLLHQIFGHCAADTTDKFCVAESKNGHTFSEDDMNKLREMQAGHYIDLQQKGVELHKPEQEFLSNFPKPQEHIDFTIQRAMEGIMYKNWGAFEYSNGSDSVPKKEVFDQYQSYLDKEAGHRVSDKIFEDFSQEQENKISPAQTPRLNPGISI